MRLSIAYTTATGIGAAVLFGLIAIHPGTMQRTTAGRIERERALVARLGLTDICLFTEATYLRHPNMADRCAPFQDHPMALAHYPSDSLLPPPGHIIHADRATSKGRLP